MLLNVTWPWRILFFVVVCCLIASCRPDVVESDFRDEKESPHSDYHTEPKILNESGVRVAIRMRSDLQKGELVVMMKIKNNSRENIAVDFMNCALNIDAERVAVPEVLRPYKSIILYDDEENYEIYFHPINSMDFFNAAAYRGDMKQQYSLDVNFLSNGNGRKILNKRVVFHLPDSVYQSYLRDQARQRLMNIFRFDFDSATFDAHEINYLSKIHLVSKMPDATNGVMAPVVYSIDPAITINRMIFNINCYKEKDTLTVNMRMLNEDSYPLKIIPEKCVTKIFGESYAPVNIFSDSFKDGQFPGSAYVFSPGTRLHLRLKYFIPRAMDKCTLTNDWLLVRTDGNNWKKLLFTDFAFRESMVTKTGLLE
jgi:hypothetical protein